jgi:hypothetical protein
MKSKFLIALTAVFVLAFAAAVYAFNTTNNSDKTAASCCAKKDSCPLKDKNASASAEKDSTVSCCDKADCCCKSGACPMKSSGEKGSADCCGNCCGGSCPMKNKQTEMSAAQMKDASCPHNQTAGS